MHIFGLWAESSTGGSQIELFLHQLLCTTPSETAVDYRVSLDALAFFGAHPP